MFKSIIWQLIHLTAGRNNRKLGKDDLSSPNILVMRYGFLGDVLQTTPILKALRKAWPEVKVDYWVSNAGAPALSNNPHISSVVSADQYGPLNLKRPFAFLRHASMLRAQRYDLAICLGSDPIYGFLAWLAGVKFRVGLITDSKKAGFLNHWIETSLGDKTNRQKRYAELLELLGLKVPEECQCIDLYWQDSDERKIETLLGSDSRNLIVFFCGTGPMRFRPWAQRRWAQDKWQELAKSLVQRNPDIKIVLIGTEQEREITSAVATALPPGKTINLVGKTNFNQLGAVLKPCRLLISNDSAPVFVAAAVGCPSIVIYGPEWPERARPLNAKWHPVYVEMECRDNCCSFPGKAPTCRNECMGFIAVEAVVEAIDKVTKDWD